ncbi:LIM/homeobox protein Lhx2b isoform X2 [Pseudoliparis swirei]|uniref:LIM/homeobox protein Lhx2b isoform X2 n=1 Tax=Pseudoliparis swirei TaxID=2059687 RepID=UPI0024BDF02C|nr:LIM/homeobox protein Lhx2b isoform X2 [Pseudoliparis swirei]
MDILACRSEQNIYNIPPPAAAMLFHGLPGGDGHGVVEEMERRGKSESAAISSAIGMGETDTSMPCLPGERVALCAGCGRKISDRFYLLAVDKQWHMRCLKCCECKLNLESELTCFSKDGSIYCKEDYYRFSVQRCARCHLGISASEMVMRARDLVYHLNCFTCTACSAMLSTGDHFGMKDSLVYCRGHFEALLQGDYHSHFSHADVAPHKGLQGPAGPLGLAYFNGVGTVQKGRPRKRKSPGPGAELAAYNAALSCNENEAESLDSQFSSSQKTKRMRTSFKHHQLRTMKSYFAINHNPDAKDLKQLAQKTGLTKRVLQVWFQNARAKFRRNLLRQESGGGGVDKASDGSTLPGPASDLSNASMSPASTPTTLTDLSNPTMPTVTSVLSSVPGGGGMDAHECRSPSQTTLTSLF